MFAYCGNNPVNCVDSEGKESLAADWGIGMGWLPAVDGPFPVGEIIYIVGLAACGVADYINYCGVNNIANVASGTYDTINSISNSLGSTTSNPPPNGPKFRQFTSGNFRYNLKLHTGQNGDGMEAHHVFPQHYKAFFNRANININDPKYGTWVDPSQHHAWSHDYDQDWFDFIMQYRCFGTEN